MDRATKERVDEAITKNFNAADALADVATQAQAMRRFEKEFFIYINDAPGRAKYRKEWTTAYDSLTKNLDTMIENKAGSFTANDKSAMSSWRAASEFYGQEFKSIMDRADTKAATVTPPAPIIDVVVAKPAKGAPAAVAVVAPPVVIEAPNPTRVANDAIGPGKDRFRELIDGSQKLRKEKIAGSAESVASIQKLFTNAGLASLGIFVLALVVAVYLMVSIPKAVTKPIADFVGIADKISKGDVSGVIHADGAVEFQGLSKALERLRVAQFGLLERMRAKAAAPPAK